MRIDNLTSNPRSAISTFVASVTGAYYAAAELPNVLMYYPASSLNPFPELLYKKAADARTVLVPLPNIRIVDDIGWGRQSAVHFHWLHQLLKAARSEAEAGALVLEIGQSIRQWKERGMRIIWTVHNILPHQPRFPDAELALHKLFARQADLIHIMNAGTAELVKQWYSLPKSRTVHLPHPSYAGWYGNAIERSQARQMLGIADDESVFLFFGSIQAYKGVLELIDAFEILRDSNRDRALRLIIAGVVSNVGYANDLQRRAVACANISVIPESIPEEHVQVYFKAADTVVAPYVRTLNSGVALLATTFRKPMVAPSMGAMVEVLGADHPLLYDSTPEGLIRAMQRSLEHIPGEQYFDQILARHEPGEISRQFFSAVSKVLGHGSEVRRRRRSQGRKK